MEKNNRTKKRNPILLQRIENFLLTLIQNYIRYNGKGLIEFKQIRGKKEVNHPIFSSVERVKEHIPKIVSLNETLFKNCYSVNPQPPSKKKRQKDIQGLVCLWIDTSKVHKAELSEALNIDKNWSFSENKNYDNI